MLEKLKRVPLYAAIFAGFCFASYDLVQTPEPYKPRDSI
mgnify:CR=1 FL=1